MMACCCPTISKSRKDVHNVLRSICVETNRNENYIFDNDDLNEIIIFLYNTNIEF